MIVNSKNSMEGAENPYKLHLKRSMNHSILDVTVEAYQKIMKAGEKMHIYFKVFSRAHPFDGI